MNMLKILFALTAVVWMSQTTTANDLRSWQYHGVTLWDHPDGRQFQAAVAETKLGNDSLSIARNLADNRWYIRFTYDHDAEFGNGTPQFFIESTPPDQETAVRAVLTGDASPEIFQKKGVPTKYIAAELSDRDLGLLMLHSENNVGIAFSLANGSGPASSISYRFDGTRLEYTLIRIEEASSTDQDAGSIITIADIREVLNANGRLSAEFFMDIKDWQFSTSGQLRSVKDRSTNDDQAFSLMVEKDEFVVMCSADRTSGERLSRLPRSAAVTISGQLISSRQHRAGDTILILGNGCTVGQ